ncbi:MAG: hypothetical protein KR126chlam5_00463 [Candidatus Anoxychlamydiales bacterium]|nr:hypothetical protein [Candidatus Anoxychlamydiales bacterium]
MGINVSSLSMKFVKYLSPIGQETISRINKKRLRFLNTIKNALESLASNKKKEIGSLSFKRVECFSDKDATEKGSLESTSSDSESGGVSLMGEEAAVAGRRGEISKAKGESIGINFELQDKDKKLYSEEGETLGVWSFDASEIEGKSIGINFELSDKEKELYSEVKEVVEAKEEEVELKPKEAVEVEKKEVKDVSANLNPIKWKNALKVSLALASIAVVAFSYYYFSSISNESSELAATYMTSSVTCAREMGLEGGNGTFTDGPPPIFNRGERNNLAGSLFSGSVLQECPEKASNVSSNPYPIIGPVVRAARNATEAIVKNGSEKIAQLPAGYARGSVEAGVQFFKATIGLFGQILAMSVAR